MNTPDAQREATSISARLVRGLRTHGIALGMSALVFAIFLGTLRADARIWLGRGVLASTRTHFMDLENILAGARCAAQGMDVLVRNPCDSVGRPMNYPRVWLAIADGLGLSHASPVLPGIVLAGWFFLSAAFLPRIRSLPRALVWLLALLSPAVTLAVERGNNDLVVFSLAVLGLALLDKGTLAKYGAGVVLFLVSILKLFPAFGLLLLPSKHALGRRGWVYLGMFILATLATWRDVLAIGRAVPHDLFMSFGGETSVAVFCALVFHSRLEPTLAQALGCVLLIALIGVGLLWGVRKAKQNDPVAKSFHPHLLYGTLLFLGAFATGSNYDYRLIVLLLVLPTTLDVGEARLDQRGCRTLARVCTGLVLLSLWVGGTFPSPYPAPRFALVLLDMLATPILVCALTMLACALHLTREIGNADIPGK